jgi:hypothetical protein
MKKVRVRYHCDRCGKIAAVKDAATYASRWRRVSCGGLRKEQSVALDARHACSFKCAALLLLEMASNLGARESEK